MQLAHSSDDHFHENFSDHATDNLRIESLRAVLSPQLLIEQLPLTPKARATVVSARIAISNALSGKDNRIVAIVGPCSIHCEDAAMQYAEKLNALRKLYAEHLIVVMRVYFEKPRTTVGWKGYINDPSLDGSCNINEGLRRARELLIKINETGVPCATEFLDCLTPQYISDTIAYGAIGARTTESPLHRQLASGLSMPVGFKNGTSGDIKIASDAVLCAAAKHSFLSITKTGVVGIVHTKGNPDCHIILRGGNSGTNYDSLSIMQAAHLQRKNRPEFAAGPALEQVQQENKENSGDNVRRIIPRNVVVDCSHGNSRKDHRKQGDVVRSICQSIARTPNLPLLGIMLESNLREGAQQFDVCKPSAKCELEFGVSITDSCIDLTETEALLKALAETLKNVREMKREAEKEVESETENDLVQ